MDCCDTVSTFLPNKINEKQGQGNLPICICKLGGLVEKKQGSRKKKVSWGDSGFIGKISFGCYNYKVFFMPMDEIPKYAVLPDGVKRVYGTVQFNIQEIYIGSDASEQMKKLTMWHELTHVVMQNNNVGDGYTNIDATTEDFIDTVASRYYELMTRNPEMAEWLNK